MFIAALRNNMGGVASLGGRGVARRGSARHGPAEIGRVRLGTKKTLLSALVKLRNVFKEALPINSWSKSVTVFIVVLNSAVNCCRHTLSSN